MKSIITLSNGDRYVSHGERLYKDEDLMYAYFKTLGVSNDILLCPDPSAETLDILRRTLVGGPNQNYGYKYQEVTGEISGDKLVYTIDYDGYTWTCTGDTSMYNGNLMSVFYRTTGIDNDVLLCQDPSSEDSELYRRTRVPGTESYEYTEIDMPTPPGPKDNYLTLTALEPNCMVKIIINDEYSTLKSNIEYSIDGGESFQEYTIGDEITLNKENDSVKFRGNNETLAYYEERLDYPVYAYHRFHLQGKVAASGHVTSLLNGVGGDVQLNKYSLMHLFDSCTSLVTAPELPSTVLSERCYEGMFNYCTSLVTAPELPARTLAPHCYFQMFYYCNSLVTAPELPARTLAPHCYHQMFFQCTSLVTAPELPSTVLSERCYRYMFSGCTSLVTAPELPARTLAPHCYSYMFSGCTSLVTAPELPATVLSERCYSSMFWGCTSLVTAPELPATALVRECYNSMFSGCTSLVTAPELPATTLSIYCYREMFSGCTSLVTAPELPATALVRGCYYYMFERCSKLNYIKALFTTTPSNTYTGYWVSGVAPTGTFVKNANATWDVIGNSGVPNGWTIEYAGQEQNQDGPEPESTNSDPEIPGGIETELPVNPPGKD